MNARRGETVDPQDVAAWLGGRMRWRSTALEVGALHETHTARVYLCGELALKVRKPVRFSFLDYSSPARRTAAARAELRIGTRISPLVYLGVWSLGDGPRLRENARGKEPIVAMRRLDERLRCDVVMRDPRIPVRRLDAVVGSCVEFHQRCRVRRQGRSWRDGVLRDLRHAWEVNFEQMPAGAPHAPFRDRERSAVIAETSAWLDRHEALFRERVQLGRFREGHGDLRAEHVFLTEPWSVIDPLEFDVRLRTTDVAAEVGFLAMELELLGRADAARHMLRRYAELSNDASLLTVAPFFRRYRATVRAKVAWLRALQVRGPERARGLERAREAVQLALQSPL